MDGSAVYAATVAATVQRLREAEARPPAPTFTPDPAKVEHYCIGCDLSWKGPAPCWGCSGQGVERPDLSDNDRALWQFSNTYSPNYEGETR